MRLSMKKLQNIVPVAVLLALLTTPAYAEKVEELSEITVSGTQEESTDSSLGAATLDEAGLAPQRTAPATARVSCRIFPA